MSSPVTERARELRNNPTDAENALWKELRKGYLGVKFRRQYPIGPYFADITCKEKKLIVELDGGQHSEEADQIRTAFLEKQGYRILRFWNNEVLSNIEGVMTQIEQALNSPPLPPRVRGGMED